MSGNAVDPGADPPGTASPGAGLPATVSADAGPPGAVLPSATERGTSPTGAGPRIRPAVDGDFDAIAAIYAHHVLHGLATFETAPPDPGEMRRRWQDGVGRGFPYLVAERGDRVLGYAYASSYRPRPAYRFTVEDSIYVAADATGLGAGRGLLEALIEDCARRGFRQMVAVIGDSGNVASIGLHRACGFAFLGVMPAVGFKFGRWVDSVQMQRSLGDGAATLPG